MSSSRSSSSQRRQMMQPWPLCLMPFSKSKERSILPNYYTRVPTIGVSSSTSSNLVSDCASNSTIATTASPFNSQQALISEKRTNSNATSPEPKNSVSQNRPKHHYYAENLRHTQQNSLHRQQIYNPLSKDQDLEDYKQLSPLMITKDSEMAKEPLESHRFLQEQDPSINGEPIKCPVIAQFTKEPPPQSIFRFLTQVLAALSVSLGSMVVGFACSYTSPALVSMKDNSTATFEVTPEIESWIGSIMPLSALFGGIFGGPCIEYLGRRNTILGTAFPFIGAWLLIALANNVGMILAGRALSGFCVGIASLSLPVYLGETIQPEVRGTLGLLPTALGNIGILLCFVAGMYLNWSNLALLGACLPVPFLLLMFLIPETPRWYISKGKTKRARKSLQWLRGRNADVTEELTSVEKTHVESERNASQSPLRELMKKNNFKPLSISLGLMFFQQMSGINAVIFYTVQIFEAAGSTINGNICTIIVGIVNFASTFVATALIDRLGRKILLYISSVSMIITLFTLGGFFYAKDSKIDMTSIGFLPLVSFVIYVIGFSLGFGPIPWLMMGEILPVKIRGSAASVATAFNWLCTFIVTKTFNDIMFAIGSGGTFWLFGFVCVAGLIFVIFFVPETRGHSLEEIEKRLTGPVRRMSAVANMKPMPTAC